MSEPEWTTRPKRNGYHWLYQPGPEGDEDEARMEIVHIYPYRKGLFVERYAAYSPSPHYGEPLKDVEGYWLPIDEPLPPQVNHA